MKIMSWEDYLANVAKMADAIAWDDKTKEIYGIPRDVTVIGTVVVESETQDEDVQNNSGFSDPSLPRIR